ncbi:glycosyltransferase family 4 protein [uncultured Phascolarctobacterium sp.]|uniref:glycosyltransferase family 4 protein n=1 Tax=uncultured Phascolarctobacterium sp. TaxID=512296 RepID=UPI0025F2DD3C|nr:glycosyltransferase family 4 protein [uncultured Phascolarctobacterium sp.]
MQNICFLLDGFQSNGGIGRVTSLIANELCRDEEYSLTTIAYRKTGESLLYELSDQIKQYYIYENDYSMTQALLYKNIISKLKKILQREKIDILVACGALFFPVAILATIGTKIKCIAWEHSNGNNVSDHKFQKQCRYIGTKFANATVVLTKQDLKIYKCRYSTRNIYHIYNPVDQKLIRNNNYLGNNKKIISVGRLCYQKNYPMLIKIAKEVLDKNEDWSWDIYGDGPDKQEIEMLIKYYDIEDRVVLKGQVNNLYEIYQKYDFLVMTSHYEGFGMVLLEALSNNLPLIAFDVECGPREVIVDNINGYLIKPFDVKKMIQSVDMLCKSGNLRRRFSFATLKKNELFDIDIVIEKWKKLFKNIN